jgi:hypothetical protein
VGSHKRVKLRTWKFEMGARGPKSKEYKKVGSLGPSTTVAVWVN